MEDINTTSDWKRAAPCVCAMPGNWSTWESGCFSGKLIIYITTYQYNMSVHKITFISDKLKNSIKPLAYLDGFIQSLPSFGWIRVYFPPSAWYSAVLQIQYET